MDGARSRRDWAPRAGAACVVTAGVVSLGDGVLAMVE